MSPTARLCGAAGLTIAKAARRAGVQPRYLERCVNRGCSTGTADALVRILGCDPVIFIWGYAHWEKYFSSGHTGVARSDTYDTPARRMQPLRRHILKVIPGDGR